MKPRPQLFSAWFYVGPIMAAGIFAAVLLVIAIAAFAWRG